MFRLIEIAKQKIKKFSTAVIYYYQFYLHCFYLSSYFQKILSRWKGITVAEKHNQTLRIQYLYDGKQYEVYVPFERKLVSKMMNQSVHILKEDTKKIIIHQPGVPYMISPGHLGGDSAILYSLCAERKIEKHEKIDHY